MTGRETTGTAGRSEHAPGRARIAGVVTALALGFTLAAAPGCYPPQILTLRSGLDSLRAVVDTMSARDSVTYRLIQETRREMAEQRDILLSTKATAGSTTQELFEQMGRLEGKLDEVMGRFQQIATRPPSNEPAALNASQLYDQATQDLTQGRYSLALQTYREIVQRFPGTELADNAQYGVGECLFAQSKFDSAAVEYRAVEQITPNGDKVPAALYKLALCQEKLEQAADSKKTLEDLVKRFPLAGEAQLARERLGTNRRR